MARCWLILLFLAGPAWAGELYKSCQVFSVSDGDSLRAKCEGRKTAMSVRLLYVDAPELAHKAFGITEQPGGQEAKAHLSQLCLNQPASISVRKLDRYRRHLAVVTCNGVEANAEQVKSGNAWSYMAPKTSAYPKLQAAAQAASAGLWATPSPVQPSLWRKGAPD